MKLVHWSRHVAQRIGSVIVEKLMIQIVKFGYKCSIICEMFLMPLCYSHIQFVNQRATYY
jgi:hypothetical protein